MIHNTLYIDHTRRATIQVDLWNWNNMDLNLITIEGHIWYKLKVWELHLISSNLYPDPRITFADYFRNVQAVTKMIKLISWSTYNDEMNEMISQEFAWDYKKIRQLFLSNDVQKLNLASDLNKLPTAKFLCTVTLFR